MVSDGRRQAPPLSPFGTMRRKVSKAPRIAGAGVWCPHLSPHAPSSRSILKAALPKKSAKAVPEKSTAIPGRSCKTRAATELHRERKRPDEVFGPFRTRLPVSYRRPHSPRGAVFSFSTNENGRGPHRNACGTGRPSTRLSRYRPHTNAAAILRPHPTAPLHRRPVPGATDRPANPTSALIHLHPYTHKKGRPKSGPAGSLPHGEGCMYRLVRKRRRRTVPSYMRSIRC